MKKKNTDLGMNRTGIGMSPIDSKNLLKDIELVPPSSPGDETVLAVERAFYIESADPMGSVPIPSTFKGVLSSGAKKMTGVRPEVFIDKLGERLAFERSGVRLYDALLVKCETLGLSGSTVGIDELKKIRNDEFHHFKLVHSVMEQIGADPTAVTPCANVNAVAAKGLFDVMVDPRTQVVQCVQTILIAELADNAGWEVLIELAQKQGFDQFVTQFQEALAAEQLHLSMILTLFRELTFMDAQVEQAA